MIRTYRIGEASAPARFEYFRLPFAMLYGFPPFAERPDLYTLLGAPIIVASTLLIARREQLLNRQQTPAA